MTKRLRASSGQSLIEFSLVLPFILMLALGVIEVGYMLLDQHIVTKLSREGSNMISRDTPLVQAGVALSSMSTGPVDFPGGSKLIFSVVRKGSTVGTTNYNQHILYQRYEYGDGTLPASTIQMQGSGTFNPPDYVATGADTNAGLRIQASTLPPGLTLNTGGMLYVTEIYTRHQILTPFNRFGFEVPDVLYSIAYF